METTEPKNTGDITTLITQTWKKIYQKGNLFCDRV